MSDHKFDRLLSEIRNEQIDDSIVAQAGERVWSAMTASPMAEMSTKIRRCTSSQGWGWMNVNPQPNMETSTTSQSRHIAAGSPSM